MADKKITEGTHKGALPPAATGASKRLRTSGRGPKQPNPNAEDPNDAYSEIVRDEDARGQGAPTDRFGRLLMPPAAQPVYVSKIGVGHKQPAKRARVNVLAPETESSKAHVPFHRGGEGPGFLERRLGTAPRRFAAEMGLEGQVAICFADAALNVSAALLSNESINSAKLHADAQQELRRGLEQMDDAERKQTIASLMAYIGQLQASGVLESVPSARLARVAKLIGEAAEVIAVDPSTYVPLFRDREPDPKTGKLPTALQWFDQVWKPRVEAGAATGDEIRQTDPAFYSNWASMLTKRGQKVSDVLPPSPTRSRIGPTEKDRTEHQRKRNRDRMRRYRAGQRDPG